MDTMRIIEAKHSAMIDPGQMRRDESKVVTNDFAVCVCPNFLSENAETPGTRKNRFIVGEFAQAGLPAHGTILPQMMRNTQHLRVKE